MVEEYPFHWNSAPDVFLYDRLSMIIQMMKNLWKPKKKFKKFYIDIQWQEVE
jgi:hypothetical protein